MNGLPKKLNQHSDLLENFHKILQGQEGPP